MPGFLDIVWFVLVVLTFCSTLFGLGFMNYQLSRAGLDGWTTERIARRRAQVRENSRSMWAVFLFGMLMELGAWAITTYPRPIDGSAVAFNMAGAALAGAAAISGNLLGFLFGIPRTLTTEANPPQPGVATEADAVRTRCAVNTNLEQISDWLTKILVGLGLTQLTQIPGQLRGLAEYYAGALGGPATAAEPVVAFSVVYFVICGFFFGYLWTRLFLSNALRAADDDLDGHEHHEVADDDSADADADVPASSVTPTPVPVPAGAALSTSPGVPAAG